MIRGDETNGDAHDEANGETNGEANCEAPLERRLEDLEWRYCLAMDEIRQLSDVVRADGEAIAALESRLKRLERRLVRAASGGLDGADDAGFGATYDSDVRDDWPESD